MSLISISKLKVCVCMSVYWAGGGCVCVCVWGGGGGGGRFLLLVFWLLRLRSSVPPQHIEQVHEHRHLGAIIDDEFSWRPHVTCTCKTISNRLYLLSQFRHFVDTPKRKLFYHASISPHLTYASTLWDGCSNILFNKIYI